MASNKKSEVKKITNKKEKKLNDNDKKIQEYQRKKWILICLSFGVIILEVLALFNIIDMLWGCGLFLAMCLLKKFF